MLYMHMATNFARRICYMVLRYVTRGQDVEAYVEHLQYCCMHSITSHDLVRI